MKSDYEPILFSCPSDMKVVELYFIHDPHKGSAQHDGGKWSRLKAEILGAENRYALFLGDMMENAVPGSKSDVFTQTMPPQEQKEWFTEQLCDLRGRVVGVIDGNHERNRTTRYAGLYPLYDCCIAAGVKDLYRPSFMFVDIGVGRRTDTGGNRQVHYAGYCVHRARDLKNFSTADTVDGIDFMAFGHDHDPKDHPRAKLVWDAKNKRVTVRSVEVIDSGSFLTYGGYGPENGYRPLSDKLYKLVLDGERKRMQSVGFYV